MLTVLARDAALSAIVALLDRGSKAGELRVYNERSEPLAVAQLSVPAFATPRGGATVSNAIASAPIQTTGRATTFAFVDGDGHEVLTGDVGVPGSTANLIFPSVQWTKGEIAEFEPYHITMPE